jgi:hypothetical protein
MHPRKHNNELLSKPNKKMEKQDSKIETPEKNSIFDKFKQGDIIFGLQNTREKVNERITEKGFHHTTANTLNNNVVEMAVKGNVNEKEINKLEPAKREHFNFLNQHHQYLITPGGKPIKGSTNPPLISSAYRRACKLLLISRNADRKHDAHFITKDIIWKQVCRKEISKDGITDSELRAAYRDHTKNGPNPHVFFYNEQNKIMNQPPWELHQFKHHWKHYEEAKNKKRKLESNNEETKRQKV